MSNLEIALAWNEAGFAVFPCFEKDTWVNNSLHMRKSPDTNRGFYDATLDVDVIKAYWGANPNRLVGVRIPDEVGVLDIDIKVEPPVDGYETLEKCSLTYPETFTVTTPSGGQHLYYKKDPSLSVKPTANLKLKDGRILEGIDRRTAGSYTIAYSADAPDKSALTLAPDWFIEVTDQVGSNAYSGGLTKWLSELPGGEPDRRVKIAISCFPDTDFGHNDMLRMQTELVKLGAEAHPGVGEALEMLQSLWLFGEYDNLQYQADWNSALEGAVKKFGGPSTSEVAIVSALSTSDSTTAIKPLADAHDSAAMEWVASCLNSTYCWTKYTGWLGYEDGVWKSRSDENLREAIRKIIHKFWEDARRDPDLHSALSTLKSFLSKARLSALEALLRGFLEVEDTVLDSHIDMLNAKNGVIDLKTGELLPHDPSYYFTKQTICDFKPNAKHPDWTKALAAIPEYALDYIHTLFGQSLTGFLLSEDIALVLGGGGRNGKSTICDLSLKVMGRFAVLASPALLTAKDSDHTTELTDLVGKRFALLEEFPQRNSLNVSRLKRVVGTAEISGRRMRQDNQTWDATHTLVITTNHEIHIPSGDDGTWRRLVKINFPYRYVADPSLPNDRPVEQGLRDRLLVGEQGQHEAVLAWLVEGAVKWFANDRRLPKLPKEVQADIEEWRASQDSLGSFLKDVVELDPATWVTQSDLHQMFKVECGIEELDAEKEFNSALKSHEFIVSNCLKVVTRQRTSTKEISRPNQLENQWTSTSPLAKQATLIKGLRFKH